MLPGMDTSTTSGRGVRLGTVGLAIALATTACSGTDEPRPSVRTIPQAHWTNISIDSPALPGHPTLSVSHAIGSSGDLPATMVGTATAPGEPTRPVVWHPTRNGPGEPEPLDVPGTDGWPGQITQVRETTYVVVRSIHRGGESRPHILSSIDRRTWAPVDVPSDALEKLAKREVDVDRVVDDGNGHPAGLGASHDEVVVVNVKTGAAERLPAAGDGLVSSGIDGAATLNGGLVVLVSTRDQHGKDGVSPMRSDDGGLTWQAAAPLAGSQVDVAGVAIVGSTLVATGDRLVNGTRKPRAWTSPDGLTWKAESVGFSGEPGWSVDLSAPTAGDDSIAFVAVEDSISLETRVLRRNPTGRWEPHGPTTTGWTHPGSDAVITTDGSDVVVARAENGDFQIGRINRTKRGWAFARVDEPSADDAVSWWESIRPDGDDISLIGGRPTTTPLGEDGWKLSNRLMALRITDSKLVQTTWDPGSSLNLAESKWVTAPDGSQVVIDVRESDKDTMTYTLEGWHRRPGGSWRPVRGLEVPHSANLQSLDFHAGLWVLTVRDRADMSGGHEFGAVWTSRNGRRWTRDKGPFDLGDQNSWLTGTCTLPNGEVMAVGGRDGSKGSSRPLAFIRRRDAWERLKLGALGSDVTSLSSCTSRGTDTVITGSSDSQRHWTTGGAVRFKPLRIGKRRDEVGDITVLMDGFVAPGTQYAGGRSRPVVWLSADGDKWRALPVPVQRAMSVGPLATWGDRLVVALTSTGGPGVFILENVAELLHTASVG